MLSNILPSRLIPYAEEIIGDHQCVFRRNRSTTDHIFGIIRQILEKKWEHNDVVHQFFTDFEKAYDSVGGGGRPCTIFSLRLVSPRNR
jgi:hypothetical protein